jgi:hypothetical protein
MVVSHGTQERPLRMKLDSRAESPVQDAQGAKCGFGRSGAIVELSLSLGALGLKPGDKAGMLVRLVRDDMEVDRLPRYGELELTVPDPSFERAHWHV